MEAFTVGSLTIPLARNNLNLLVKSLIVVCQG
jgi:hypothetical protein